MKAYKLIIDELTNMGNDEPMCLWSRGHHDFDKFIEACCDYAGINTNEVPEPKYEYWRWVPTKYPGFDIKMLKVDKPGAGVFPVTVAWY